MSDKNNIETGKFLSIVFNTEYDATNRKSNYETYLKIDVSALRGGLLHHVKGSELTVLLAIASFMDKNGECYPTQRQIAEVTGLSLTTVNKAVSNLLDITINGMPILERSLRGSGQKKNSIYTIFDIAPKDVEIGDHRDVDAMDSCSTHVETVDRGVMEVVNSSFVNPISKELEKPTEELMEAPFKNSKDIAHYFANKYKEQYGKSYVINYKRDLGLIKNKLVKNFNMDEIANIIDLVIEEYPKKWGNKKYPYPTIGMLCSWLCNEAVKCLLVREQQAMEEQEIMDITKEFINEDYSDFMSL